MWRFFKPKIVDSESVLLHVFENVTRRPVFRLTKYASRTRRSVHSIIQHTRTYAYAWAPAGMGTGALAPWKCFLLCISSYN